MDRELFAAQSAAVRAALADSLGCDIADFEAERLVVVDRPDPPIWPWTAIIASVGLGTVVSVVPELRDFAASQQLDRHYAAMQPRYLSALVSEAAKHGLEVSAESPKLLFALAAPPPEPVLPEGYELRRMDPEWMAGFQAGRQYRNAVGHPVSRANRNYYAYAALTEDGDPAAIAGVFSTFGIHEIGVDVLREHRGRGLANTVVAAATRAILEDGHTPLYGCDPTNLRSHRTALACGFMPVASDATIA